MVSLGCLITETSIFGNIRRIKEEHYFARAMIYQRTGDKARGKKIKNLRLPTFFYFGPYHYVSVSYVKIICSIYGC